LVENIWEDLLRCIVGMSWSDLLFIYAEYNLSGNFSILYVLKYVNSHKTNNKICFFLFTTFIRWLPTSIVKDKELWAISITSMPSFPFLRSLVFIWLLSLCCQGYNDISCVIIIKSTELSLKGGVWIYNFNKTILTFL
jgi:hypothetical protein